MLDTIHPDALYSASDPELRAIASEATLRKWRQRGHGPAYFKPVRGSRNGRVLYRGADIIAWWQNCRVEPAAA